MLILLTSALNLPMLKSSLRFRQMSILLWESSYTFRVITFPNGGKRKGWLGFCFFNSLRFGLYSSKWSHVPTIKGHLNFRQYLDSTFVFIVFILSLKNTNHLLSKCVHTTPCWRLANCWWINIYISNDLYGASFSTETMRVGLTLDSKNHEPSHSQGWRPGVSLCNHSFIW